MAIPEWVTVVSGLLAPGGFAALGVRLVLNGSKERIKGISEEMPKIRETLNHHGERLSRIEGKLEQ